MDFDDALKAGEAWKASGQAERIAELEAEVARLRAECATGEEAVRRLMDEATRLEAEVARLKGMAAKWRDEAHGVQAMGYSQQADRMRDCADDIDPEKKDGWQKAEMVCDGPDCPPFVAVDAQGNCVGCGRPARQQ